MLMLQEKRIISLQCSVKIYLKHHKNSMQLNSISIQPQNIQLTVDASTQKCTQFTFPRLSHPKSQHPQSELYLIQRDITRKSQKTLSKLLIDFLIPCNFSLKMIPLLMRFHLVSSCVELTSKTDGFTKDLLLPLHAPN